MPTYKRLTEDEKTQIICLHQENLSNLGIAHRLQRNEASIRRFLKTWKETGRKEGRIYTGRPRILNNRDNAHLKRLCLKNRFKSASKLKEELFEATQKSCSTSTIERRLKDMGLNSCRLAKKPLLTAKMRSNRLQWCKERKNWTASDWKNVIFSDESKVNLLGADGGVRVRRRKGERFNDDCVLSTALHSPYVMIWGAMTGEGVGALIMLEGFVNAEVYKKIIIEGVIPTIEELTQYRPDVIFQDDSAPCHRTISVKKFKEELGIKSLDWPGNSPDLNPIENLWSIIKRKIRQKQPESIEELKQIIALVWFEEINVEILDNLYKSMPGRILDVIKAKGGHINK